MRYGLCHVAVTSPLPLHQKRVGSKRVVGLLTTKDSKGEEGKGHILQGQRQGVAPKAQHPALSDTEAAARSVQRLEDSRGAQIYTRHSNFDDDKSREELLHAGVSG